MKRISSGEARWVLASIVVIFAITVGATLELTVLGQTDAAVLSIPIGLASTIVIGRAG